MYVTSPRFAALLMLRMTNPDGSAYTSRIQKNITERDKDHKLDGKLKGYGMWSATSNNATVEENNGLGVVVVQHADSADLEELGTNVTHDLADDNLEFEVVNEDGDDLRVQIEAYTRQYTAHLTDFDKHGIHVNEKKSPKTIGFA